MSDLQFSDDSLRQLVHLIPSMVWIACPDGHADFLNDKWYASTGLTVEESIGQGWIQAVHPDDRKRLLESIIPVPELNDAIEIEVRYRMADGCYRWHLVRARPIANKEQTSQWFGISCDIDEKYASEEMSEAQTRAIVETAVDGIITIDANGIVHSMNPAAETIFGYEAADVTGNNISMLMPEPFRSQHDQYVSNYLQTGVKKIIGSGREVVGLRKDGTEFPMDLAVSEIQLSDRHMFTGIVRDVTSRKQMECDLLDREQRYRSLVETAASVILFLSPDGDVMEWNREAERIFGYARDEVLGKNYFEMMLHDEVRAAVSDEIDLVLRGRPSRDYENPVVTQNGQQRMLSWNATRMKDTDGKIQGLVAVGQDITDLTEAREKLLQSERLAAMGEMLSGIAHESRNALQRIQAGADMLGLEIGDNKEAKDDLARITRAREDLSTLFEELRNFAAPVHLNKSDCDLGNIWRRAWTHLESVRENRVAELNEGPKEIDLKCKVDAFRMEQVFRNLIENSLAAREDPVQVDIDCEGALLNNEPAIHVSFRDNGPGLTDEQQEKIFDAFYTTKTKGTGLGMAIARRIIEAHQGEIRIGPRDAGIQIELVIPR